jgi:hypothetical protein
MAFGGEDAWNKKVMLSTEKYAKLAFGIRWNDENSTAKLEDYNTCEGDLGFYSATCRAVMSSLIPIK